MSDLSKSALRWIVAGLCIFAAIRVFVFAAAFPFFNNVDEQAHVDLVVKYAHGNPPRGIESFSHEASVYFATYSTPEYFVRPEQYGGQFPPANWLLPREQLEKVFADEIPFWESRWNHESGEPPLYYLGAGAWFDLGRAGGLGGLVSLYWVRFLNVGLVALLVWLGFVSAKSIFPTNQFIQLAVPTLLAVWPQTAFYSIQADALSPICFGIAFLGLAKILQHQRPQIAVAGWSGLALAATCLVKTSNLPLPIVATAVLLWKILANKKREHRKSNLLALIVFVLSCALPLGIWFLRNHRYFGDLTATTSKIELLGWTRKPFVDWWSHPLFTISGLKVFWTDLAATFWRGELVWHLQRLASPYADAFYAISTALVILATGFLLLRNRSNLGDRRFVLSLSLFSFISIVGFLMLLSVSFDFHNCPYPSREFPYLTSGRLLNGVAIPFFVLFAYAIHQFANWANRGWLRWTLLGAIALFLIVSQVKVNSPAFASQYNFFHRPMIQ